MTTKKGTIDEKATTKNQKMFCFRCGAEIPEKIKRKTDKYKTIKKTVESELERLRGREDGEKPF